jgi:hypothetical protein
LSFYSNFHLSILVMAAGALALEGQPLAGTAPLEQQGDLAAQMVAGIDRYLMRGLGEASARRLSAARKDPATLREHLRTIIGAVDQRLPFGSPAPDATLRQSSLVASSPAYEIHAIRWPVFEGVDGEGLLLEPRQTPRGRVVAIPDAGWTPEMLAGLAPGLPPESQFARRLAEAGFLVVVPVVIDREDTFSGKEGVRFTNQPHREFIYRMAYEMGRHITGYEVQKVLALVDWFAASEPRRPVGVIGYGEGGLLALYSAALDERINAAVVSGYFAPREDVWRQPIYRNVWSQLETLGDAELAGLAAPRTLIIEASPHPEVPGPPPEREGRRGAAPGGITTPPIEIVRAEFERARKEFQRSNVAGRLHLVEGSVGSTEAVRCSDARSIRRSASLRSSNPSATSVRGSIPLPARGASSFN